MTSVRYAIVASLLLLIAGCERDTAKAPALPSLPTIQMQLGSRMFQLEVAANDADRAMGLMHRDSMPVDRGMIFVFADEQPRSFWMKNTRIPLDIVYVNAAGAVVDVKQMIPHNIVGTPSAAPAKYAIELNRGLAAAAGIKVGDQLNIPTDAREPK